PGNYDFYKGQGIECHRCQGDGECQAREQGCNKCNGNGRVPHSEEIVVKIEQGVRHKQKVFMPLDDITDYTCDYTVLQMKDPKYIRKGDDLYTDLEISLQDALLGVDQVFTTLDDRSIRIKSPRGTVLKPDQRMCVENEGMPLCQDPKKKGNLYLAIKIKFPLPDEITLEHKEIIEKRQYAYYFYFMGSRGILLKAHIPKENR
ncbi:hypothetical protein MXB_4335, partial [Myxobolus squamalis]